MKMSDEQIDEYLDWYEKTWISRADNGHETKGLPKQLLDMFPTGRTNGPLAATVDCHAETLAEQCCLDEKLRKVQNELKLRPVIPTECEGEGQESLRRPGSFYKRYRTIQDLPLRAKKFHEAAASLIGVSLTTLFVAVRQMEVKLLVWRAKRLKEMQDEFEDEGLVIEHETVSSYENRAGSFEPMQVDERDE